MVKGRYIKVLLVAGWSGCMIGGYSQRNAAAQPVSYVNVFLGSSGDHGQMSPAASAPFGLLSIGPQTYPNTHTGYEYAAKTYLGFTHNRLEGVGCMGSGGNLLITPFVGLDDTCQLEKVYQNAGPGWFNVAFRNGIEVNIESLQNFGTETYFLPQQQKGFSIDFSHTLANGFVDEEHHVSGSVIDGWIDARTTCGAGIYRTYYSLQFSQSLDWKDINPHKIVGTINNGVSTIGINVALSAVSVEYAKKTLAEYSRLTIKKNASNKWNSLLTHIKVNGDKERTKLFYSLLYRTMQSPFVISETDGHYRNISGEEKTSNKTVYNGWSVWDNYKTQLPLLSLFYPNQYQDIITSLAQLYPYGKKDYATQHEPSNTVRTEHTIVVLLDAYRKGYKIDFLSILDSLQAEVDRLDFSTPDKALEYSYDTWAMSEIFRIVGQAGLADRYLSKALDYRQYWERDFKDVHAKDVDRMQARHLYQGTIWQYRWFVPFDMKGLMVLDGGSSKFLEELNYFFEHDLYNHANEPDIQVPSLFNVTNEPWRSQELMHKYAVDTVVQYYFNDNSRGIDPFVDRIYKNEPKAYVRTMDDDAGANSAWFVLASVGLYPACVGWPIYYLSVPLFPSININFANGKHLTIKVDNFGEKNIYIQDVFLNGKKLERNFLSQQELQDGGTIVFKASPRPNKAWGVKNQWISSSQMKATNN
ncbi:MULTISPECIES: glycoside hydrolase domain-containing protein [Chitinophagaceae]